MNILLLLLHPVSVCQSARLCSKARAVPKPAPSPTLHVLPPTAVSSLAPTTCTTQCSTHRHAPLFPILVLVRLIWYVPKDLCNCHPPYRDAHCPKCPKQFISGPLDTTRPAICSSWGFWAARPGARSSNPVRIATTRMYDTDRPACMAPWTTAVRSARSQHRAGWGSELLNATRRLYRGTSSPKSRQSRVFMCSCTWWAQTTALSPKLRSAPKGPLKTTCPAHREPEPDPPHTPECESESKVRHRSPNRSIPIPTQRQCKAFYPAKHPWACSERHVPTLEKYCRAHQAQLQESVTNSYKWLTPPCTNFALLRRAKPSLERASR